MSVEATVVRQGPGVFRVGGVSADEVSTWVLDLASAGAFSLVVRGRAIRASRPLDGTATALYYEDRATGVGHAGTEPITSPGVYAVAADGCEIALDVASGTVLVTAVGLRG